jgi:hypothetical protein
MTLPTASSSLKRRFSYFSAILEEALLLGKEICLGRKHVG